MEKKGNNKRRADTALSITFTGNVHFTKKDFKIIF